MSERQLLVHQSIAKVGGYWPPLAAVARLLEEIGEAIRDMISGTSLESDLAKLWEELKLQESLEAKIVKDADTLDCDLELRESDAVGTSLLTALRETRDRAASRLYTDTARRLFGLIYSTDPHSWHVSGKNRMTAGDWKDS